jgi:hypothetical protein
MHIGKKIQMEEDGALVKMLSIRCSILVYAAG